MNALQSNEPRRIGVRCPRSLLPSLSHETITISKPMRLIAVGGRPQLVNENQQIMKNTNQELHGPMAKASSRGVFPNRLRVTTCALSFLLLPQFGGAAERQVLPGHVSAAIAGLQPVERLAGTNRLDLILGLPLRNQEALTNFLEQLYDPASTNYRRYLSVEQIRQRFGSTIE